MPKKGDSVEIFENYITREKSEGFVTLVEQLKEPTRERWEGQDILVHYWDVRFAGERTPYPRFFTTNV